MKKAKVEDKGARQKNEEQDKKRMAKEEDK
jgi:hypothetical protein